MDASREMDADDLLGAAGATGDPLSALDGCDFGGADDEDDEGIELDAEHMQEIEKIKRRRAAAGAPPLDGRALVGEILRHMVDARRVALPCAELSFAIIMARDEDANFVADAERALLMALETHRFDSGVQRSALTSLFRLHYRAPLRTARTHRLDAAAAFAVAKAALLEPSFATSADVVSPACLTLACSAQQPDLLHELWDSGAIRLVVDALRNNKDVADVQVSGLIALNLLLRKGHAASTPVTRDVARDAWLSALAALQTFVEEREVASWALAALKQLWQSGTAVVHSTDVLAVLAALRKYPSDDSVQINGVAALSMAVSRRPDSHVIRCVYEADTIPVVVNAMRRPPQLPPRNRDGRLVLSQDFLDMHCCGCMLLRLLTNNDAAARRACTAGAVGAAFTSLMVFAKVGQMPHDILDAPVDLLYKAAKLNLVSAADSKPSSLFVMLATCSKFVSDELRAARCCAVMEIVLEHVPKDAIRMAVQNRAVELLIDVMRSHVTRPLVVQHALGCLSKFLDAEPLCAAQAGSSGVVQELCDLMDVHLAHEQPVLAVCRVLLALIRAWPASRELVRGAHGIDLLINLLRLHRRQARVQTVGYTLLHQLVENDTVAQRCAIRAGALAMDSEIHSPRRTELEQLLRRFDERETAIASARADAAADALLAELDAEKSAKEAAQQKRKAKSKRKPQLPEAARADVPAEPSEGAPQLLDAPAAMPTPDSDAAAEATEEEVDALLQLAKPEQRSKPAKPAATAPLPATANATRRTGAATSSIAAAVDEPAAVPVVDADAAAKAFEEEDDVAALLQLAKPERRSKAAKPAATLAPPAVAKPARKTESAAMSPPPPPKAPPPPLPPLPLPPHAAGPAEVMPLPRKKAPAAEQRPPASAEGASGPAAVHLLSEHVTAAFSSSLAGKARKPRAPPEAAERTFVAAAAAGVTATPKPAQRGGSATAAAAPPKMADAGSAPAASRSRVGRSDKPPAAESSPPRAAAAEPAAADELRLSAHGRSVPATLAVPEPAADLPAPSAAPSHLQLVTAPMSEASAPAPNVHTPPPWSPLWRVTPASSEAVHPFAVHAWPEPSSPLPPLSALSAQPLAPPAVPLPTAALSAPPRRVPPPYRPPSGAPASEGPAPTSVFAAVDASLAAQLAQQSISAASGTSGLSNAAGEYNCFLNSLVQALYRLTCFREHLLHAQLPATPPAGSPASRSVALVAALRELIVALERGAALRRDAATAGDAAAVAPTALRHALAALSTDAASSEGGMFAMADASEVLSTLYDAFAAVSKWNHPHVSEAELPITRMFSIALVEAAVCGKCRKITHRLSYRTNFHIVSSTALRDAHRAAGGTLEALLRQLERGCKGCDVDEGGCGTPAPVEHRLSALPQVFTISLTWESSQASEEDVAATMRALSTTLCPEQAFYGAGGHTTYELRSMVCFYGSHYVSLARTDVAGSAFEPSQPAWTRFDDACVTEVGNWEAVCRSCSRGHLQPTVLFFERSVLHF